MARVKSVFIGLLPMLMLGQLGLAVARMVRDGPFRFLVDRDLAAATGLKIAAPGGTSMGMQLFGYAWDTVLPTVVITDAQGTILFADQTDNYRHRPEPETFLRVFDDAN